MREAWGGVGRCGLGAAVGARVLGVRVEASRSGREFRRPLARERVRLALPAGGQSAPALLCAAILLHCASAACLTEAIGISAAPVRQACFALLSAVFTFALLVVI